MKSSNVDQCVWMLISGLEPAEITLWASTYASSLQARVTSQKWLRSLRCNKEATVVAFYSSGQNESRSFQHQHQGYLLLQFEIVSKTRAAVVVAALLIPFLTHVQTVENIGKWIKWKLSERAFYSTPEKLRNIILNQSYWPLTKNIEKKVWREDLTFYLEDCVWFWRLPGSFCAFV